MIPKDAAEMVAATIRTIFAQPTAKAVRSQLDTVADMLGKQFPKVKQMLIEAKDDLTALVARPGGWHCSWLGIRRWPLRPACRPWPPLSVSRTGRRSSVRAVRSRR